MLYIDKKGKRTIINTLTKTGAITKRNKKSVISITANDGAFEIVDKGKTANNMSIPKVKKQPKVFDEQPTQNTSISKMFDGYLQGESTLAPQLDTRRQMPISKIPDLDEYEQELAKYEKEFNELNIQKIKYKNTPKYNEIMERRIKVLIDLLI